DRTGSSLNIHLTWPFTGKRRLRRDTLAIVQEIHAYVQAHPSDALTSVLEWQAQTKERESAKDDAERREVWNRYIAKLTERWDRDRQAVAQAFGGKSQALVQQFRC